MALGRLVSKQKGQKLIRNLISECLPQAREMPYLTEDSWIRASSLYRVCAREEVLAALLKIIRTDKISASLRLIFEHGHALHHQLQNSILPEIGVLYGQWRCSRCSKDHGYWDRVDNAHETLCLRPKSCNGCDYDTFTYQELHFEDDSIRISGHPDGFLVLPGMPGVGILEGKSIGVRGGLQIKHAPMLEHVIQCQVYMMLTGCKWAKIIYWQKSAVGVDAIVEYLVEYDQEVVAQIRSTISSIWRGIFTRDLPERICASESCERAKGCSLSKPCFEYGDKLEALSVYGS